MAGMDDRFGRKAVGQHPYRGEERVPVGAGQVHAADRAREEEVAAEELAVRVVGDVRGGVAGHGEALEGNARDLDRLVAAQQVLGRVRPAGNAHGGELGKPLEALTFALGHPDLGSRPFGEVGDASEMVEVAVRDEDPGARGAEPCELEPEVGGLAAGVYDDALGSAAVVAHDVAVRLKRSERVSVDGERHGGESSALLVRRSTRAGTAKSVRHWRLPEVDTPRGSRSPVVLHSREGAERAVLIELLAGEALGDHGGKESALLLVLEGSVRVEAGDESIEAEAGSLFQFDPDERRSVTSDGGARLLLLLAPWPGEGHYRGERAGGSGVSAS